MLKKAKPGEDDQEQRFQDFIETNTRLFYPPFSRGHNVHFSSIISKFKLDTSLTTDLAYLTKNSNGWYLVLVELERPTEQLFTKSTKLSCKLTDSIAQVKAWMAFVKKNPAIIDQKIRPLKKPLEDNLLWVKYALIIGRTTEYARDQDKVDSIALEENPDFKIMTYDSLLNSLKAGQGIELDVLRQVRSKFSFKYHHRKDTSIFAWLSPNELRLSDSDKKYYKNLDYDIDSWEQGKLLRVNNKQPQEKLESELPEFLVDNKMLPQD